MRIDVRKLPNRPLPPTRRLWAVAALALASLAPGPLRADPAPNPEGEEFFEKHVRPIFAAHCLECHGPTKQEASLRFDRADAVRKGSDGGPILHPDDPASSPLLVALQYEGDVQMPPDGKLADEQIAAVRRWIEMGAPWPDHVDSHSGASIEDQAARHWAFQPVVRPGMPDVAAAESCEGPIDRFLLQKLEAKGLGFAPVADRRTWLRRASMDVLGLPPTYEEVEAIERDDRPDVFDRWTDRLLASPHHGEKWARHWLDVARYADTKGYVFTANRRYPFAFTYRDYVIRAFNEDLGYDRFIRDQLAADKAPLEDDKRALAAMGFLTVGRRFLNNPHDVIDDRIDVVSRGLLGLTVTCARCHDHKYDPIPMADYYSLYGVFASSVEPGDLPVVAEAPYPSMREAFEKDLADRHRAVDDYLARKAREREEIFRKQLGALVLAAHEVGGNHEDPKLADVAREVGTNDRTARLFVRKWQKFLSARLSPQHPVFGAWAMFQSSPPEEFEARSSRIVEQLKADAGSKTMHPEVVRPFQESAPKDMREVVQAYGKVLADVEDVRRALDEPGSPLRLTPDEASSCLDQQERNELQGLRGRIDELKATHPGAPLQAMVMQDGTPQDSPIFLRGNPNRPGEKAPRQFLAVLEGPQRKPFEDGSGRGELAGRIADPKNPLTARVMVNRLWHWRFGRGVVRTTSDFGLRSDPPTHPELLDWLASEFVERGWSLKAMHREMLSSRAFRQASVDRPEGREADPQNDLLWSFRRRRLDFEELRDATLAASGELDRQMHGRPADLTGPDPTRRRAVYAFIDRQNLDGLFRTFDFANPNTSAPQRYVTTVPQQALYMMNSPFILERSRALARDPALLGQSSLEHGVDALFRRVFVRPAQPRELEASIAFLAAQESAAQDAPGLAWRYGFGRYDRSEQRVTGFSTLSRWNSRQWQPGERYPDPEFGHLAVTAEGGHPGRNDDRAAVRRWVSPRSMRVSIQSVIRHRSDKGDGVEAVLASSRRGELGAWTVFHDKLDASIDDLEVEAGEHLDFIVAPRGGDSYDGFEWTVRIDAAGAAVAGATASWDSVRDFSFPADRLSAWEKLAHVLLLTNEFAFVD